MNNKNNILMGIFCIIMSGIGFSLMALFIKLSGDLPSMQKGFFRNIIAVSISSIPLIKHWKNKIFLQIECRGQYYILELYLVQ